MFYRLMVLVWIFSVLACSSAFSVQGKSVEKKADGLVLRLTLEKIEYVEQEPIIARVELINDSDETRRLGEPSWCYSTMKFKITPLNVSEPAKEIEYESSIGLPMDYGWDFAPREGKWDDWDLRTSSDRRVSIGEYSVSAVYTIPKYIKDVWHGEIETPVVKFAVVPASGVNRDAATALRSFNEGAHNKERMREFAVTCREIENSDSETVYGRYTGYIKAMAYNIAGDREPYISALCDYVSKHGNVPYYGRSATRCLGKELSKSGDYAGARAMFERLPDGYEKSSLLRQYAEKASSEGK